ncbi:MAG: TauD/TfdA family dioxygenase, partial [Chromatiales bacterium]|nr:TauD/TfdA family dioxygenase [Chromatiales bacterium]
MATNPRDIPTIDALPEPASITVAPSSLHIGAEIGGVDLAKPLAPEQVADIRNALL